ncbi:hypothetical protein B0H67DRAFT_606956 [Lasiosphaeris hirsuta]|uniref:Uncharacterized protein n=1 Tax=Lasiosphaeris hirsuta TaxID=260670 RepID=A0AA40E458_9PEZI|nr:hypothetical protein B0H67DRAFT_606956 [Lasiosphaeris hirsuta]
MAKAGCTGPTCTFLGDRLNSEAKKGRCTDTQGYISNAEIYEIIATIDPDPDSDAGTIAGKSWHDKESNSDILVYEETEWVAYMSKITKETRRKHWMGFNFAGTIDWAVDLQSFTIDDFKDPKTGEFPDNHDDDWQPPPVPSACKGPSHPAGVPIYMIEVLSNTLKNSMATYDKVISDGYDKNFNTYADAIVKGGKKAVRDWTYKNGNTYFTCDVVEPIECCDWCYNYYHVNEKRQCKYCDKKYCNGWSTICDQPENLKDIIQELPTAITKLKAGTYDGTAADLVDATALPVFMIEEAVTNIKTISDTIDEMEEERRKEHNPGLPVRNPVLRSALASIGRVIAILGTAGQVALDIYSVVDSKGNDPLDIFGLVLAPLAVFDVVRIGKAAARARGTTDQDIGKLAKNVKAKMDLVRKANSACELPKRNVFPMGALQMTGLNGDPVWSQDFM